MRKGREYIRTNLLVQGKAASSRTGHDQSQNNFEAKLKTESKFDSRSTSIKSEARSRLNVQSEENIKNRNIESKTPSRNIRLPDILVQNIKTKLNTQIQIPTKKQAKSNEKSLKSTRELLTVVLQPGETSSWQNIWREKFTKELECQIILDRLAKDLKKHLHEVFVNAFYPIDKFVDKYLKNMKDHIDLFYQDRFKHKNYYKDMLNQLTQIVTKKLIRELCMSSKENSSLRNKVTEQIESSTPPRKLSKVISFHAADKDLCLREREETIKPAFVWGDSGSSPELSKQDPIKKESSKKPYLKRILRASKIPSRVRITPKTQQVQSKTLAISIIDQGSISNSFSSWHRDEKELIEDSDCY